MFFELLIAFLSAIGIVVLVRLAFSMLLNSCADAAGCEIEFVIRVSGDVPDLQRIVVSAADLLEMRFGCRKARIVIIDEGMSEKTLVCADRLCGSRGIVMYSGESDELPVRR